LKTEFSANGILSFFNQTRYSSLSDPADDVAPGFVVFAIAVHIPLLKEL
jgi:hypothetical protein